LSERRSAGPTFERETREAGAFNTKDTKTREEESKTLDFSFVCFVSFPIFVFRSFA
jgi:hypothetical protein